ncbi:MAG: hypothetical protein IKK89_08790, partial [Alistipes sp.]|nr:hypothetical protein [Alistipes sp.]
SPTKATLFRGSFFCVLVWLVGGGRGLLPNPWLFQATDLMQASVSSLKQPMQSITYRQSVALFFSRTFFFRPLRL